MILFRFFIFSESQSPLPETANPAFQPTSTHPTICINALNAKTLTHIRCGKPLFFRHKIKNKHPNNQTFSTFFADKSFTRPSDFLPHPGTAALFFLFSLLTHFFDFFKIIRIFATHKRQKSVRRYAATTYSARFN